ncbi:NrsF family protein [Edaphosphingomonas haloaromaticamans]|uniref:DUF1109 domain-containing protein n=1 Tax=Edaphosphingomonas haloaromaticamans TaxID=653954 RepID=A0A1S1HJ83_9SPHN|nr:DUF1109 domain-containing protein [Sphingomonas haloaromaticamans]OHT20590.1 hypothetical protein BHE75_02589 [Sphingomonas haloaromaticamans]
MSNNALIHNLTADLTPVRLRSPWREASLLLALGALELALLLELGMMRHDMAQVIGSPYMLWKMGSLAILAGIASSVVIRSFSPLASPRRGLIFMLSLAGLAMIGGAFVASPADSDLSLLDRVSPAHGMLCAVSIAMLALPMLAMLAIQMRRAAPTHPAGSAIAAGLAAATCGALIFAFCCPMNDPLYIVIWYSAGCAAVTSMARWLLPQRFRL